MRHLFRNCSTTPSPPIGYLCAFFGAVVILGALLRAAATYWGSEVLYWISYCAVLGGMIGVVLTGLRAAKQQRRRPA